MGWGLILAGVSAVAGAFNAVDEYNANRQIRGDLDKIKNYLKGLDGKLNEVKAQNENILQKLDKLPEQIRQIVDEIVDSALLAERYSVVEDIRDSFLILRRRRRYSIRSREWQRFSEAMAYLFRHENRISFLFDLVKVSEVALIISKGRTKSIIVQRIEQKIKDVNFLKSDVVNNIDSNLVVLNQKLNNTTYISSHNLSESLNDINELSFRKQPDKTRTIYETRRHCSSGGNITWCRDREFPVQVADDAFHNARDKSVREINSLKDIISNDIIELAHLMEVISILEKYRTRLSSKSISDLEELDGPMYFIEKDIDFSEPFENDDKFDKDDYNNYLNYFEVNKGDDLDEMKNTSFYLMD